MWQCERHNMVANFGTMKYKSDFKKVEKSDFKKVEKSGFKKDEKYKRYCKSEVVNKKIGTNAGGATYWPNFELIQVETHTIGQIWNQCKWHSI